MATDISWEGFRAFQRENLTLFTCMGCGLEHHTAERIRMAAWQCPFLSDNARATDKKVSVCTDCCRKISKR